MLSTCCSTPTVGNGLLPECPITTIVEQLNEEIVFNTGDNTFEALVWRNSLPGCTLNDRVISHGAFSFVGSCSSPNLAGPSSVSITMRSNKTGTWTKINSETWTGNDGVLLRPGTNVVIRSGVFWARQNVRLSQTSALWSRNEEGDPLETGIQDRTSAPQSCCEPDFTEPTFCTLGERNVITTNNPNPNWIREVRYLPVVSVAPIGLSVGRNGSVSAQDPWRIQVSGNVISLTSSTGTRHEFSGSLTTVRDSINALGIFTASLGSGTNGTNALVSDLKPKILNEVYRFVQGTVNCTGGGFDIAEVGDEVAPGISGNGAQGSNGQFLFDALATGRPNTHAGYLSWLSSPYFPKLSEAANPGLAYEGATGGWIQTSGNSTKNTPITATATKQVADIQITCGPRCVPFIEIVSPTSCAGDGWEYDNCPGSSAGPQYMGPAACAPGTGSGSIWAWYQPAFGACPEFYQVVCTGCNTDPNQIPTIDICIQDVGEVEVISKTVVLNRTLSGSYVAS